MLFKVQIGQRRECHGRVRIIAGYWNTDERRIELCELNLQKARWPVQHVFPDLFHRRGFGNFLEYSKSADHDVVFRRMMEFCAVDFQVGLWIAAR